MATDQHLFYIGTHERYTADSELLEHFVEVMVTSGLDRDEIIDGIRPFALEASLSLRDNRPVTDDEPPDDYENPSYT